MAGWLGLSANSAYSNQAFYTIRAGVELGSSQLGEDQ